MIYIVGAGGHARVVAEALRASGCTVHGFIIPASEITKVDKKDFEILDDDQVINSIPPKSISLVNGIGNLAPRQDTFNRYTSAGFQFISFTHPFSSTAQDVTIKSGVQILAGAIVNSGTTIQDNTVINTNASVDHDCQIGPHVHIAPGATICGNVQIGAGSMVGAGATVIQNIQIGSGCVVAAGAVVCKNVPDQTLVKGVPAKSGAN